MSGPGREHEVLGAVIALVDSLLDDFDVVELLTDLTERCVQLLDIASAGLLLADPQRHLHLMAATSGRTHDLELFQLQSEEGPCLDCFASGAQVSIADLHAQAHRWPRFAAAAAEAGFASVHAVPMRAAGITVGALGLFGTRTGPLTAEDLAVGQALAHVATVAILQEHAPTPHIVLPRLIGALTGQVVVEQAKGFLREQLNLPTDEAFTLLRAYARSSDTHLSEISRKLINDPESRPGIMAGITDVASSAAPAPPR